MVNLKGFLGASAVVGAVVSSVLFATPAGAAAPPPTVKATAVVLTVTGTAGSGALLVSSFFVPGCFSAEQC